MGCGMQNVGCQTAPYLYSVAWKKESCVQAEIDQESSGLENSQAPTHVSATIDGDAIAYVEGR